MEIGGKGRVARHGAIAFGRSAYSCAHVSAVMGNWIGRKDTDQSAHGVTPIECTLWAAHDIDTLNALKGEVVG